MLGGQTAIGVDIGHASVRVVGLSGGKLPVFRGCKEIMVDSKYLQKEGFDNHAAIAKAIRQAMDEAQPKKINAKEVYVTISESMIFRKLIEISKQNTKEQMTEAIRNESAQYLPEPIEKMELDYQVLGSVEETGVTQVMIVAVSKRLTEDLIKVFNAAKLTPRAFEPKPESVGRALVSASLKKAVLIVDIGQSTCTVSAYDQGIARATSALNVGTLSVFDPSTGEAPDEENIKEKMPRLIGQIADEIDHVVKYYSNRTVHVGEIEQIYLSGAGSILSGAVEMLAKAVDQSVEEVKPIIAVGNTCDRRFYGALGAALYAWLPKK